MIVRIQCKYFVRQFCGSDNEKCVEDDDENNGAMKFLLAIIIVAVLLSRRSDSPPYCPPLNESKVLITSSLGIELKRATAELTPE